MSRTAALAIVRRKKELVLYRGVKATNSLNRECVPLFFCESNVLCWEKLGETYKSLV